jgi:hypothetical protein
MKYLLAIQIEFKTQRHLCVCALPDTPLLQ